MKKIFEIRIKQENEIHLKDTFEGNILISPTCGGEFSGISSGRVEPVGMLRTCAVRPGCHNQELSVILTDEDGNHILVETSAFLDWSAEVEEMICSGKDFDKAYYQSTGKYNIQGTAAIRTDSEKYRNLERKILRCPFDADGWDIFIVNLYECEII